MHILNGKNGHKLYINIKDQSKLIFETERKTEFQ